MYFFKAVNLKQISFRFLKIFIRWSAKNIIGDIASEMRKKMCHQITATKGKVPVLLDESTTVGVQSTLIVYLNCEFQV